MGAPIPGIGVEVGVGVIVGVAVEVGLGVTVGVSVKVGLGVIVGPRTWPGAQADKSRPMMIRTSCRDNFE